MMMENQLREDVHPRKLRLNYMQYQRERRWLTHTPGYCLF